MNKIIDIPTPTDPLESIPGISFPFAIVSDDSDIVEMIGKDPEARIEIDKQHIPALIEVLSYLHRTWSRQ